jgi:transglutaminase-like putative cysteine protease
MGNRTPATALSQRQSAWLMLAAVAAAAPLMPYFPYWISLLAAAFMVWRGWLLWRRQALPPRWLLSLAALSFAALIGFHYRTIFGKDPGVALLIAFLSLKTLETRAPRDAMAIALLCLFLALGLFFYTQNMAAAASMVTTVWLVITALINLNHDRQTPWATLRLAGFLLAQATPFMLLLFVLFPRISGPLWGLPVDAYSAISGLSDTMSPGSISRLSQSDAIAFRARFAAAPPHADLYWRGPVLTEFDGRTWRASRSEPLGALPEAAAGDGIGYEVTLEPHNRRWLFALELPITLPAGATLTADYQLLAKQPIHARLRYALRSRSDLINGSRESPGRLRDALQLPATANPRARQLGAELRTRAGSDAGTVQAMLAYFRAYPFFYTLQPPLLGDDSVDQFLFEARRGFCEHYAGAFVFVLRAAGVPARVVTGYQGGEINPVDGFLEVRQYDAHAWAEVWLAGIGWRRVDPTAAIAPSRVEASLGAAVGAGESLPLMARTDLAWLRELRFRWDALNNGWNQWVLGYNPQRQRDLLRNLGMGSPDWQTMTAWLATLCGVLMLALTAWAVAQRRRLEPSLRLWNRFSDRLGRRGLARRGEEGPRDYARRIAAALPQRRQEILAIAELYETLRYAPASAPDALRELSRRVRSFTS